jgi:hypothetical protein
MWRRKEIRERFQRGNLKKENNLRELGIDGRSKKYVLNTQSIRSLNGFMWLRIRPSGEVYEDSN